MEDLLSLTPRFQMVPNSDGSKIEAVVAEVRAFVSRRRLNRPQGIVWTNVDGAIADCLETIGRMCAQEEFAFINQMVAEEKVTKAHELWLKFHVLLVEKKLEFDALVDLLAGNHELIDGVFPLQEKLLQRGIVLVAITNGVERFLRKALEKHHFVMPLLGNDIFFDDDGSFQGLKLIHGPGWLDKGRIIETVAKTFTIQPLACIGNGPSDISMARATIGLGGTVVSRGTNSPLSQWCHANLKPEQFLQYTGEHGLRGWVSEIVRRCANAQRQAAAS